MSPFRELSSFSKNALQHDGRHRSELRNLCVLERPNLFWKDFAADTRLSG